MAELHDFASSFVGATALAMFGLAGVFAVALATRRVAWVAAALAIGAIVTWASAGVTTRERDEGWGGWGGGAEYGRSGAPAYFEDSRDRFDRPRVLVDGLFWSGCAGLVIGIAALRRR